MSPRSIDASESSKSSPADLTRPTRLHGSACDTCRRRRIRCDGSQPCDRCLKSAVSCTYGSVASRTSSVSYARQLEQKVTELQQLLKERPPAESSEHALQMTEGREKLRQQAIDMLIGPDDDYIHRKPETPSSIFYGCFGGLNMLRFLGDMATPLSEDVRHSPIGHTLIEAFEMSALSPHVGIESRLFMTLPSKQQTQDLINYATRTALILHDCLDYARFSVQLDHLYEIDPEDYSADDKAFLSLLYALLALGKRYSPSITSDEIDEYNERVKPKGLNYFSTSFALIQAMNLSSLDSIRAIIYQTRYLLSGCMMSKAYSHICTGVVAALRMGLHVSGSLLDASFSPDEMLQRRRVFSTLNMMDTYMSSLLGLPKMLNRADPKQRLGLRREDLVDNGRNFVQQNPTTSAAETLLGQKLMIVLARINKSRYASANDDVEMPRRFHQEDIETVMEREAELVEWHNELPDMFEGTTDIRVLQAQLNLRLWYSVVQIILYRPFLHHLSRDRSDPAFNIRGFEYGSACVRAAMQAVWLIEAFKRNKNLHEGYWLNMYILGFAVVVLTYFVTSCTPRTTVEESTNAAWKARDMLALLGKYNFSARKCYDSLSTLFSSLPARTQE